MIQGMARRTISSAYHRPTPRIVSRGSSNLEILLQHHTIKGSASPQRCKPVMCLTNAECTWCQDPGGGGGGGVSVVRYPGLLRRSAHAGASTAKVELSSGVSMRESRFRSSMSGKSSVSVKRRDKTCRPSWIQGHYQAFNTGEFMMDPRRPAMMLPVQAFAAVFTHMPQACSMGWPACSPPCP